MNIKELIFGKNAASVRVSQYHGSTQKWLPVADIRDGVIITKDGRFIKLMEVLPVNFYLLSPIEQQNMIHYFWAYLKVAPETMQVLVVTQKADIQSYIDRMWEFYENEPVEGCRQLIEDNIREVTYLASNEAVTHRFFVVIQYDGRMKARANSVEAIAERLWEEEQTARRYLGMCGLEVISVEYPDNFHLEVLYGCINKRTSRTQKLSPYIFDTISKAYGVSDEDLDAMLDEGTKQHETEISDQSL